MINNELLKEKILNKAITGKLVKNDPLLEPVFAANFFKGPFEVPLNWRFAPLDECASFFVGRTPSTKEDEYWQNDIDFVSISDMVHREYIKSTKRKISKKALQKVFAGQVVLKNTLLMSFKLTIGRLSITSKKCVHNEAIISLYPKEFVDQKYLMNALDAIDLEVNIKSAIKGKTLNSKSLSMIPIALPPYKEQIKIALKLEKIFSLIKKKEENDKKLKELKKLLQEKILDEAIHAKLVANNKEEKGIKIRGLKDTNLFTIPKNWKWVYLEDIITYQNGYNYKSEKLKKDGKGYPVIKSTNIAKKKVIVDYKTDYVEKPTEKMLDSKIKKGDILMILSSQSANIEPLGVSALYTKDEIALLNQRVLKITVSESDVDKYYLLYCINSNWFHNILANKASGLAQANLKLNHVLKMKVPLPPYEEQIRIVNKIEKLMTLIDNLE